MQDQCRRLGAFDVEHGGVFAIGIQVIPVFAAEIERQKTGDIRCSREAHQVGDAGPDGSRLESLRLRDDPRGHEAAVAPAHDAEPLRVGDALRDQVIDAAHDVLVVAAAPVLDVGLAELLAVGSAAARVGAEDGVALPGEDVDGVAARLRDAGRIDGEAEAELECGAAVDVGQEREFFLALLVVWWQYERAFDFQAVLAFPSDAFHCSHRNEHERQPIDHASALARCHCDR